MKSKETKFLRILNITVGLRVNTTYESTTFLVSNYISSCLPILPLPARWQSSTSWFHQFAFEMGGASYIVVCRYEIYFGATALQVALLFTDLTCKYTLIMRVIHTIKIA
jgi:hypothetical protein